MTHIEVAYVGSLLLSDLSLFKQRLNTVQSLKDSYFISGVRATTRALPAASSEMSKTQDVLLLSYFISSKKLCLIQNVIENFKNKFNIFWMQSSLRSAAFLQFPVFHCISDDTQETKV